MVTSSSRRATDIASRFAGQYGVATRRQLIDYGVDFHIVDTQLLAGRWQALNSAVVVLHNGPLTPEQELAAVVLSAEAPVAVGGLTGAMRHGLQGFPSNAWHIVVRRGAKVLPLDGIAVRIHESRRYRVTDVISPAFPPTLPVERCVVDAAAWSVQPREACRLVTNAVQQRLTSAQRLRAELERAGRIRHSRLLRTILCDLEGGAEALSEQAFLRFCRHNGFPPPQLQVRVDVAGRRRYLDALLRGRDGRLVGVEVDGGVHLTLTARWRDTARDNDLLLQGRTILRFPSVAIYTNDPTAVRQLGQALGLVRRSNPHRAVSV